MPILHVDLIARHKPAPGNTYADIEQERRTCRQTEKMKTSKRSKEAMPQGSDEKDDIRGIDDDYEAVDTRHRRRNLLILVVCVLIVAGLLFLPEAMKQFNRPAATGSGRIEKEATAKKTQIGESEWKILSGEVKAFLDAGRLDDAMKRLAKVFSEHPDIPEAYYLAGVVYMRQGRIQSAYDQLKQAVKLKPDDYAAQEKLGEIYLLGGDYKAAKETAAKLGAGGAYLQDGLLLEAEIAAASGDLKTAEKKATAAATGAKEETQAKAAAYLADLYLKQGNQEKADRIVGSLDKSTMNAEGLLSLAKYYLGAANETQAEGLFREALNRYPDSTEVNYQYAQNLFRKNRFREAQVYYRKALTSAPGVQIISYQLAQSLLAGGQLDEAKIQIAQMEQKNPNSMLALGLRLQYELLLGERRQAIETLSRISRLIPYAPRPYTMLANLYWQEGLANQTEANARKAIAMGEKTALPHLLMGDALAAKKQFPLALAYVNRVLEVQPRNLMALLQAGDLYLAMEQPEKARELYERALADHKEMTSIQTKIAWAKARGGDMEGALALNRRHVQEKPGDTQALMAYANTLVAAKRLDEALDLIQKAVPRHPKAWELFYVLGDLQTLQKNSPAAAANYTKAVALNPTDLNLALNVGARIEQQGLDKATEDYYIDLRKRFPQSPLAANQLAWFYIDRLGVPEKAKPFVDRLAAEGQRPELSDTVGWYYFKTGQYASAEHYFRRALMLAPEMRETRARLALALYALKRNEEAAKEARQVMDHLADGALKARLKNLMKPQTT